MEAESAAAPDFLALTPAEMAATQPAEAPTETVAALETPNDAE
jgi:hypothetical protein